MVGWVAAAGAQGPVDAGIRGQVLDARGGAAVWSHVVVRAVGPSEAGMVGAGFEREFAAGKDGSFILLRLEPGEYEVRADEYAGEGAATTVTVGAGELAEVTLSVPASAGGTAGVGKTGSLGRAGAGMVFLAGGESGVEELPLQAGEWMQAGELEEGAVVAATASRAVGSAGEGEQEDEEAGQDRAGSDAGAASGGFGAEGMGTVQGSETVDGAQAVQGFRAGPMGAAGGGPSAGASYGQGAVRSLRVMPRSFSAKYGGGVGGVVAVTSKGAVGEGLHGSGFLVAKESGWGATNPFSVETHYRDGVVTSALVKPAGSVWDFGGEAGTPLGKERRPVQREVQAMPFGVGGRRGSEGVLGLSGTHRWAVFGSVDGEVRDERIVSTPAVAGFYDLTAEQVALLATRGVGAAATNAALDYLDSLTGTTQRTATRVLGFGRVDWAPGEWDRVTAEMVGNRFRAPKGTALGTASDAVVARGTGSLGDSTVTMEEGIARWLHVFTPGMTNEVRGQLAHDLEYETPHAPLAHEPGVGPGGFAPEVSIAPNGFAYGTPSNLGRSAWPDEWRVGLGEQLQVLRGRHLVTIGGEWSRVRDRIASVQASEGAFLYDSGQTGVTTTKSGQDGGLVDWVTDYTFNVHAYPNGGCPSITATVHDFCFRSYRQGFGGADTTFVMHDVAAFAEDAMRLRPDLTVTLGARYEYTLLPLPQMPNAELDAALKGLGRADVGLTERFPEDRNNVGVRAAVAWAPAWRGRQWFTVQAGFGGFFGRVPGETVRAALAENALPGGDLNIRITPTTEVQCPQVVGVSQGFGYPCAFLGSPTGTVAQTTSAMVFGARFRLPAVQRASLTVEREFGRWGMVRAGYTGSVAVQLPGSTDVNISASTGMQAFVLQGGQGWPGLQPGETFVVPVYGARPMTGYGPVTEVVSDANATYHAGMVEGRVRGQRWLRGLEMRGSYTFSRAIDYAPQSSAAPRTDGQFDPFANGYDKGLSSLQVPQRFAGDFIYGVGKVKGPGWFREAVEDWRVAAIATVSSGAPYSYNVFGGTRLTGGRESINGSGGATYLPTVGRNTLRLPTRSRLDVRLSRDVRVRGRMRVEGFVEAFNALNTVSLSSVETRAFLVGTPTVVNGATGPTPLVFQDAATIAAEGLTTPAFGTPTSSTTGLSRERQVEAGLRVWF